MLGIESVGPNTAIERLRDLHDYRHFPELFGWMADGVAVFYEPAFREFTIPNVDGVSAYVLNFCPLSGRRLPPSLRDEWFDGLEAIGVLAVDTLPPPEFEAPPPYRTDLWWRDTDLALLE